MRRNNVQHENPHMEYGNIDAKNARKVIVNECEKDKLVLISFDEKCILKAGTPGNPLVLVQVDEIATLVKAKSVDHETFMKLNVTHSAILAIDIPKDFNLGKFYEGEADVGMKDNTMHKKSFLRYAVEIAKVLEEKSKDKMLLRMNADGGGDRNPKFEQVQDFMLHLVMKLNLDKLMWEKTAAGSSVWNPAERTRSAMNGYFTNISMCRVEISANIEQELIRKKSCKTLLESNTDPIMKEACTQLITLLIKKNRRMDLKLST